VTAPPPLPARSTCQARDQRRSDCEGLGVVIDHGIIRRQAGTCDARHGETRPGLITLVVLEYLAEAEQ